MAISPRLNMFVSKPRRLQNAIALLEEDDRAVEGFSRLSALAAEGVVEAQYRVGRAYLEARGTPYQFREGERWLRRAAEVGHTDAQYFLAILHLIGYPKGFDPESEDVYSGVSMEERVPDLAGALPWALKAAEAGHVEAAGLLGYIYSSGPHEIKDEQKALKWYEIAHEKGSPQGSLGLGIARLQSSPDKTAIALLRKAADAGLPTAFFYLGWVYELGIVAPQDDVRAARNFQKAAEGGVTAAALRYGVYLLHGRGVEKDLFQAETWLRRAALKGEAEAAAILGDLNIRGFDHAPNFEDAGGWYRLAAEMGHAAAARGLALLYLTGSGVKRDLDLAAQWFHTAAEMGDSVASADFGNLALIGVGSESQKSDLFKRFMTEAEEGSLVAAFNLGVCLAQGVGTEENPQAAIQWFKVAAKGVVNAQYWLGRLYGGEFGVEADPAASVEWLEKAADAEMPEAQVALAQLLVTGTSVLGEDHPRALKLYRSAAQRGNVDGTFGLGAMLGGGHHVEEQNRAEAQSWFRLAAERGHGLAQLMLGRYLERGLGGEVNLEGAQLWYERAEKSGVPEASQALIALNKSMVVDAG
ncbi:sel1 repeat family protein [Candidatus Kirkpatrickella diaphorinae]|uniref:Sel1 repeat family protein n=1 Tax=Candidatus Kirkpatrickella diaphorinae TaxID=2984322 RepID=A0ABY6GIN2_9PROT|nr:tetratricopeptide repeat protein [Candidatus Kirkpatrickella diaphorinae]UYH51378.1 sel1 repeat family protein [Candidatus Kirkpatrickella diaphorinae]